MDLLLIAIAFVLGFVARMVGLPPLVGFLGAGFVLHAMGVESSEVLQVVAKYGVWLLLFSIGLKLKVRSLLRPEIWATASIHMGITIAIFGALFLTFATAGLSIFSTLDLATCIIIAFALSFSSTVFAIKILEAKGEGESRHGRISVGILIVQDLFAVIFMTISVGNAPSPWALALVGLVIIKPLVGWLLDRSGHGELLVLLGLLLPLAGAGLFSIVGLKPDLGVLVMGILLSTHPKAGELSKALLSFKDLFLIGFFLTIGLSGAPTLVDVGVAAALALLVPFKVALFYLLLTRFRLRARNAAMCSLSLANYSEFGLIVASVGVSVGWLSQQWLVIIAVSLAITFVVASPLNIAAQNLYQRWCVRLRRFEHPRPLIEDEPVDMRDVEIIVLGMGRVGTAAYDTLTSQGNRRVLGLDFNEDLVKRHQDEGRWVVFGDANDSDYWARVRIAGHVRNAIFAMGSHAANLSVVERIRGIGYTGSIAAIAKHPDEVAELREAGVDLALDFLTETGVGLAEHVHYALTGDPISPGGTEPRDR